MQKPVVITIKHIRRAKMCSKGARAFFLKHNINWQKFIDDGIMSTVLEDTGDVMALDVVKIAREEEWESKKKL